ncbi:MAG: folate family ECF transporter S component [Oscillospiraceae bacterium]|nr:folate family ECF transporter S component [Oscillospiraceae bacterium]
MAIFKMFKRSALELKSLRCITVTAMLIALDLALKSVTINLTEDLKISFAFLALATIGMLFGPTVSLMAGVITDLIGFFTAPQMGAFNPMYTIIEATGAMLYGLFLYNLRYAKVDLRNIKNNTKDVLKQVIRIVLAKVSVVIVCNLIMTPLANILTKFFTFGTWIVEPTLLAYPARLLKNAIQCPVDCLLLTLVLFPVMMAYRSVFKQSTPVKSDKTVSTH